MKKYFHVRRLKVNRIYTGPPTGCNNPSCSVAIKSGDSVVVGRGTTVFCSNDCHTETTISDAVQERERLGTKMECNNGGW